MTLKFHGGNGNGRHTSVDEYPLMSSSRTGNGLKTTFHRNKEVLKIETCLAPSFIVHSPFELPGSYDQNERVNYYYGYDLEVLITPEIIKTDRSLKTYEPKQRGCYFKGEKSLKFFKIYTRRNCEFECYAEHFLSKLNCVPFYMVRNETTEVCGAQEEISLQLEFYLVLRKVNECECLEECDSIKYKFEVVAHSKDERATNFSSDSMSIEFKFKDLLIAPLRRYQPFTFSEFLAQSGGMMGLFAGISALSIIELFYFLSLRWIGNLLRRMKNK
jgi:acid-sensing ion channel, other